MWPFSTYPECSGPQVDGKTYDYVIVGGGTAGCVVASRLSEDPNVSVLVIEKGRVKDNFVSRMPLMSQNFWLGDPLQAQGTRYSEPIPGTHGRKTRIWTAEGIGGASRINAMLLTRGTPGDYNGWSEMGLHDWGWDHVEPYFRKSENAVAHPTAQWRGHDGPIESRQVKSPFQWVPYIEKAGQKLGLPIEEDCNNPSAPAMGLFSLDMTIDKRGQRISAYKAFLNRKVALERRDRLTICTGVVTSRLDLDGEAGVARGVYFQPAQRSATGSTAQFYVKARREVIVCAGAICSPQILLLSGIGPKDQLDDHGIPIVKELPAVGRTLSDHYSIPIMLELPKFDTLHLLESIWGLWHILLWIFLGAGLFSSSSTPQTIFVRSGAIDEKTLTIKARDDEQMGSLANNMDASAPRNIPDFEIMLQAINSFERVVPGRSLFTFHVTHVQPRSTGSLELASKDPLDNPRITHPLFRDERDAAPRRRVLRFAMRLAEEFQKSGYPHPAPLTFAPGTKPEILSEWERSGPTAAPILPPVGTSTRTQDAAVPPPVDKTWKDVTDEEIDDYARRIGVTALHVSTTCRMSNDVASGVVDQKLRVHGFHNLRVADASVFPKVPSGHTMAPTLMVGERCADFVKQEWRDKKTL